MSDYPYNTEFFTETEIKFALVECRQLLNPTERISTFISSVFETARDGVIEWYEFLDFLLVLRTVPRPLTRNDVEGAMKSARKKGVMHPWSFDEQGLCSVPCSLDTSQGIWTYDAMGTKSMPCSLTNANTEFNCLDTNHDGTLDKRELFII